MHALTDRQTHMHTHTHTHRQTDTHTHTHTHTVEMQVASWGIVNLLSTNDQEKLKSFKTESLFSSTRFHYFDSQSPSWVNFCISLAETDYWRVLLCQRRSMSMTLLTLTHPVSLTQLTSPQTLIQQLLQLINLNQRGKRFVFVKASTHIRILLVYFSDDY